MTVWFVAGVAIWLALDATMRIEVPASRLAPIAAYLDGTYDGNSATGRRDGVAVTLQYIATQGTGSQIEYGTAIDVELPTAYPLTIYLRPRGARDDALVRDGQLIDIELGDAAFDHEFLIAAAPGDVVRSLLDREACAFIARYARATLLTLAAGDLRYIRVVLPGWIEDMAEVTAAINACVRVASRVRDAYAAAEVARPAAGDPYRPWLDGQAARDAESVRATEVAAVDALRSARGLAPRVIFSAVWIVLAVAIAALWRGGD